MIVAEIKQTFGRTGYLLSRSKRFLHILKQVFDADLFEEELAVCDV